MTVASLQPITPDNLSGAIFAIEGIEDAAVLMHSPTGCKFYHGAIAERQFERNDSFDTLAYLSEFYFGQPRVPSTYIDEHDYVFGAVDKLQRLLQTAANNDNDNGRQALLAIVNSPGAALIGDDIAQAIAHTKLSIPCVILENPGFSGSFTQGFQHALMQAIEHVDPPALPIDKHRVNLLGLSLYHRHWQGSLEALQHLLRRCGIEMGATLSAGTTVDALRNLRTAHVNVIIHEEYANVLAPWLKQRYAMPFLIPQQGAPIGFDALESWVGEVCQVVGVSTTPALDTINEARRRSYLAISRFHSLTGLPKGATFALQADGSLAYPLTQWLCSYLGMVPIAVQITDEASAYTHALYSYLESIDCAAAWNANIADQAPDAIVGSQVLIAQTHGLGWPCAGVDIALPGGIYIDVVQKKLLGTEGALALIEQLLNGLYRQAL